MHRGSCIERDTRNEMHNCVSCIKVVALKSIDIMHIKRIPWNEIKKSITTQIEWIHNIMAIASWTKKNYDLFSEEVPT